MDGQQIREAIASSVRRLRQAEAMTGQQLASLMTVEGYPWTPATVSTVESGRRAVSVPELMVLLDLFGVEIDEMVGPLAPSDQGTRAQQAEQATRAMRAARLEQHIARVIGAPIAQVQEAADLLFERNVHAERDARSQALMPSDSDYVGRLGHITRELVMELRNHIETEGIWDDDEEA